MTDHDELARQLITRWRDDPGSTCRTWFLWEERIKNSRSIRRGLARVAAGLDDAGTVAGAFEVEHTTSIHSGIVRLLALALGTTVAQGLFLVAPDGREGEVAAQLPAGVQPGRRPGHTLPALWRAGEEPGGDCPLRLWHEGIAGDLAHAWRTGRAELPFGGPHAP